MSEYNASSIDLPYYQSLEVEVAVVVWSGTYGFEWLLSGLRHLIQEWARKKSMKVQCSALLIAQ